MAEQTTYPFLPEDKCLTESQLFDYIDGKLKATEMHSIEKHVLSCGLCSDALEGLEKVKDRSKVAGIIPIKNNNVDKEENKEPKVIPLNPNRKYYAIAAGFILIIGITLFLKLSVSNEMMDGKMANVVKKDSSSGLILNEAPPPANMDSLPLEKSITERSSNTGDHQEPNSGPGNTIYFKKPSPDKQPMDVPVQKTESFGLSESRNADGDAMEDLQNVVDSKVATEEQATDREKLKDESESDKLVFDANKKDNNPKRSEDAKGKESSAKPGADQDVATKNIDDTKDASQPTLAQGTSVTMSTPQVASNNYQWSVPPATVSGGSVTVTDTVSANGASSAGYVTKTDHELDLSYENGVKMLEAGQASAAVKMFDDVLQNPSHLHYQDAQWKKANALIQLKKITEAKKLLNDIINKNGKYTEEAKAKLKTL